MNLPDIAKLLAESWPSFIAAIIGSTIGHILPRRPPDLNRLRQQLGRALDRFGSVPTEQLESALLDAGRFAQRGWGSIISILTTAFWLVAALFAADLYRAIFPEFPGWHSVIVGALVAALLACAIHDIERRAILHRLERLLHATEIA